MVATDTVPTPSGWALAIASASVDPPLPSPEPATLRPAGFWVRLSAYLVDIVIVWIGAAIPLATASSIMVAIHGSKTLPPTWRSNTQIVSTICILVGSWLYFALMERSSEHTTLGKQLFGLKVLRVDGGRIGFGRASARYWACGLCVISLGLGCIKMAFGSQKRGLQDKVSGTRVAWSDRVAS